MKKVFTFHKSIGFNILSAFGKRIDGDGLIVDNKTGERILSRNGEEVNIKEFAGITKGSKIYLKSDIPSLIEFVESGR
ncbi:MAG: hypothetical protein AAB580_01815 [Patescibacteria group bacterium]